MKKSQRVYKTFMIILITAIVTLLISTVIMYNVVNKDPETKYVFVGTEKNMNLQRSISSIRNIINNHYLWDVPEDDVMIEGALKGYVDALDDEYTEYMSAMEWKEYQENALGNYTGLGVFLTGVDNGQKIVSVIPNSPAEKFELKANDIILKVDDLVCKKDNADEVTKYIKSGEIGTKFKLEILRENETFSKEITRELIRVIQVEEKMLENNIGYIRLQTFDKESSNDFKEKCQKLIADGAKSLIIDLRNNTGGVLTEALDISEMFLDKDVKMLITHNKENGEKIYKSTTKKEINVPIVVLINDYSASASEILVAALKDNDRATLIGTKTYGKGVLQEVLTLSNGSSLKITAEEFLRPNGEKIHKVGIEPDIEVKLPDKYTEIFYVPEEEDTQLKRAIEELSK